MVIEGEATVIAPADKLRIPRTDLPEPLMADKNLRYDQLLNAAKSLPKIRMAVVHPCSREALEGALDADRLGLIEAILIGPERRIRSLASECKFDLTGVSIVDVPHSHAAADKAVELARAGEVDALMKGSLHSDELLGAVVHPQTGLRTDRRVSHVFVLDVPRYPKPLLITDAAINVAPDFDAKVDIVQNAIDLAHALGIDRPKVAILSAVETVTPKLRSSMDAAALSKMADRGQITGGLVDGPLAFDNAVSLAAAKTKGIKSPMAGLKASAARLVCWFGGTTANRWKTGSSPCRPTRCWALRKHSSSCLTGWRSIWQAAPCWQPATGWCMAARSSRGLRS